MKLNQSKVLLARALMLVAVVAVVWWPDSAWAGPPSPQATDAGSLLRLIKQMKASVAAWEAGGQQAARGAFAALAALNITWLGVELLTGSGNDIRASFGKLARELMVTSVMYSMISFGPDLARQIVGFMRVSANGVGGGSEEDQIWNALQAIVKASVGLLSSGEVGYLEVLWLGLCVVVVIVVVGLTGAAMLMVEASTELIIGLGAIVLAGGGSIWTRFLVQNYLRFSFSAGLALYVMRFVQSFVISNLAVWAKEATGESGNPIDVLNNLATASTTPVGNPETIFTLVMMSIIQLILVISFPTIAVVLAQGGIGKVSEWAGVGAAQQLAGAGAQGLRAAMAAATAGMGAGAGRAAVGAGNALSVLGSSGGAMPAAPGGAGGAGSAREQGGAAGSGPARGVEAGVGVAGGGAQEAGAPAAFGSDGGESTAVAGSAGGEAAQPSGVGSAMERSAPRDLGVAPVAVGGGVGAKQPPAHGGGAGSGSRGDARNAWSGQGAPATAAQTGERAVAALARPAGGGGRSEPAGDASPSEGGAGAVSVGGGAAPAAGGRTEGSSTSAPEGAGVGGGARPSVGSPSNSPVPQGRGSYAGSSPGGRLGGASVGGEGAARGAGGGGTPARSDSASSSSAPSLVAGGGARTAPVASSVPAVGTRGGSSPPAAASASGGARKAGLQVELSARRAAMSGPSARGVAGKRGEHE